MGWGGLFPPVSSRNSEICQKNSLLARPVHRTDCLLESNLLEFYQLLPDLEEGRYPISADSDLLRGRSKVAKCPARLPRCQHTCSSRCRLACWRPTPTQTPTHGTGNASPSPRPHHLIRGGPQRFLSLSKSCPAVKKILQSTLKGKSIV